MSKGKQTVGGILADLGLSDIATKEVGDEVRSFRKLYADEYELDLTWDVMQRSNSDCVRTMARTYFEDGLPKKGIHPGRSRWTAEMSAAQTGQARYPIPKHRILGLLQKLIAHQNWNIERNSRRAASKEETTLTISSDSEQNYAVRRYRGRGPRGARSGLRSSDAYNDGGSTEDSQIAPVAKMGPKFGNLERTNRYTYGGLPDVVDLETHGNKEAMTSELKDNSDLMRDDHHVSVEATPDSISAHVEHHQDLLSGLADLSHAFEESLENTDDIPKQQCPSRDDNSAFQQRTEKSSLGQTTVVGPYQRQSKVIVLKWKQHKRQATGRGLPRLGSTKNSPSLATVSQNDSLDEGTKRRRLGDMDLIPTLPQPVDITDSSSSDAGYPSHISELPAFETHQSERSHAAMSKLPHGGGDSLNLKERSLRTESETTSVSTKVCGQEQAHRGSGDSKVGLQWSSWLLDPRKPGGALRPWPGNKPFSQTIHEVFKKTTELLETDRYSGIQFLFKLNNQAGEVIFQVTKGALEEFQIMKENAPRKLKQMMKESGKKVTEVDITLRPVGLTEVGSIVSAVAAPVEDQDLDGIDALFE